MKPSELSGFYCPYCEGEYVTQGNGCLLRTGDSRFITRIGDTRIYQSDDCKHVFTIEGALIG